MRGSARLPLRFLHVAGYALGWLVWAASGRYRRRLSAHAATAGISADARRASVGQAGMMAAETPWLWLRPKWEALDGFVAWDGAEHVEQALAAGRGLLVITPHLGCFEVCAQAFARRWGARVTTTVLYRPSRNPWLANLQRTVRDRPGLRAVPATLGGVRAMARALREGQVVGVLPDQVPPQGLGVWADFFGRPAYTMTLVSRLGARGAARLLFWGERLPDGRGWCIHVEPAGEAQAGDDDVAQATRLNADLERLIRRAPAQYLWGYDRWRAPRGDGPGAAVGPAAADAAAEAGASP